MGVTIAIIGSGAVISSYIEPRILAVINWCAVAIILKLLKLILSLSCCYVELHRNYLLKELR